MYSTRRPKCLQRASSDDIEVPGVVDVPGSRMLALPYDGESNHVRSRDNLLLPSISPRLSVLSTACLRLLPAG